MCAKTEYISLRWSKRHVRCKIKQKKKGRGCLKKIVIKAVF